ncbi:hypothetical protein PVL29_021234 [Vitis rotundifolia]|uniref:LOB domain-containing protein n=1 Tax=Vitis rotundifolia TaxID=103349 RepID=A0AA38YYW3_VITRO|nr:hypothetical protein PVL29_021234 [Vitis rotundifolia]
MNSRCAACKYLRRRCPPDCIFSPYFPSNNPQRFESIHRIYGASNIGKILQQILPHLRAEAVESMYYEAQCRLADPVYGCVKIIYQLNQNIHHVHNQLANIQAQIAFYNAQMHGNNQIQNAELPAFVGFNNSLADQGNAFPHPAPPPSIRPPWPM